MSKFFLTSKTMLFGALLATLPALLDYVGGVDFSALGLSPAWAAGIGAVVMALRAVTKSPMKLR